MSASHRPRRVARLIAVASVLLLAVGGCSLPGSGPDPADAVQRLARALSAGDLDGVGFVGGSAAPEKEYAAVTEGLGRLREAATVTAGEVTADGDSATARLGWSWKTDAKPWSYTSTVRLTRVDTEDGKTWQVRWAPSIVSPELEPGETLAASTLEAERGDILGADQEPLVTQRPVLRVGIDKSRGRPGEVARSASALARLVDVDRNDYLAQVKAAGPRAFVEAIVYRRDEAPARVLGSLTGILGARAISDRLPLAPTRDFAAALLGTVGPATAELVEAGKGRIRAGDDVGVSGLQKRYDEQLSGTSGVVVSAVDDQGDRRALFTAEPRAGRPLRTTVDLATQEAAQRVLADVEPASALVAVKASTGEILAAASGPGSKGYNTATYGRYAPGSTFKVVSALALLRGGLGPNSPVSCPATTVVDGKTFKNYDDYPASGLGRISLADALANSCNTAFIGQRDRTGEDGLAEAAAALGLGVDHDTGFPAFFGQVGSPSSKTQAAASMIGQGTVLASPMAMATVVASVLKGSAVLPVLLPDADALADEPAVPLTSKEADRLRSMMRGVVERGSGSLLQGLPGGPVIAKTGTAEYGDTPPLPTHAWMVAGRGDLAVAVFVETGDSGSGTAGPVLRQFLQSVRVP